MIIPEDPNHPFAEAHFRSHPTSGCPVGVCFWGNTDLRTAGRSLARRSIEADEDEATTRRSSAGSTPRQRPPRMSTLEATAARERCIGIPRPRQQGGPQGRLCRRKQQQQAQEGYSRRRQGAAIAAARREAAEAKAKTKLLEAKMKTMEATLSRVAAMLPSLERLQRRENAAATKIQAALQGYAMRSKQGGGPSDPETHFPPCCPPPR
jgi:hypothetical protein